jgi:outer membrane protein/protease secretion system outer membrane protein
MHKHLRLRSIAASAGAALVASALSAPLAAQPSAKPSATKATAQTPTPAPAPTPTAEEERRHLRWWQIPLADRLNRGLNSLYFSPPKEPLADTLNRRVDSIFNGVSLLFRAPAGEQLAWWEKPLADRLNAQIDRMVLNISRLEARDVVGVARDLGLDGPTIWPNKVLPKADAVVDANAPLTLLQAWQVARVNDPGLRAARAALASSRERVPQARAQLLPQVQLGVTRLANDLSRDGQNSAQQALQIFDRYPSANDTLSLRQPLVRMQQVVGVQQAKSIEAEAQAIYAGEEQSFSVRVVGSYLEILLAQDNLALLEAQRVFLQSALSAARRGLAGGVGTRTDVDAAQARLDLNRAQLLQARQQLEFARRQLQAWVSRPFGNVVGVDGQRLKRMNAAEFSLEEWLRRAEGNAPEMRRLRAQRESMGHELNKARAGHLPTLDFIAQVQRSRSENTLSPQSRYQNTSVGVQLNVPLYSGGSVNSVTRQVSAEVERLNEALEALKADIGVRVHREYRTVTEGVARIEALEMAVRSAEVALDSARKSAAAGVRTQVDILNAEQALSQSLRDLNESRYVMLAALVRLQSLAGESDESLFARLNGLLAI